MNFVPYARFLDHFKKSKIFASHIKNIESSYMRLLQIDNLFFTKKVTRKKNPNLDGGLKSHHLGFGPDAE